jgi:uncharacterized protein (DUF1501 family)
VEIGYDFCLYFGGYWVKLSRRNLAKLSVGAGAAAIVNSGNAAALTDVKSNFRAVVSVFLSGGSDGWNMVVPTDGRYDAYCSGRGTSLALPRDALIPLKGAPFGLHPALTPLSQIWDDGALNVVLNAGALIAPITIADFRRRPDLRPAGATMHSEGEAYWHGKTAIDRWKLPDTNTRETLLGTAAESAALTEDPSVPFEVLCATNANFCKSTSGKPLQSNIAKQLRGAALKIAAAIAQGHTRSAFSATHLGYDTHAEQFDAGDPAQGKLADLYSELGEALAAFYKTMAELGFSENVTVFTRSEFGRAFSSNDEGGTDHGWGNNHIVMGGGIQPRRVHGNYPDTVVGGSEDLTGTGCWIPSLSVEEYLAPIARWYGVPSREMKHAFPNWPTWTASRKPVRLFG